MRRERALRVTGGFMSSTLANWIGAPRPHGPALEARLLAVASGPLPSNQIAIVLVPMLSGATENVVGDGA
jgi:hypothetical protein